jgi:hypothetical protein
MAANKLKKLLARPHGYSAYPKDFLYDSKFLVPSMLAFLGLTTFFALQLQETTANNTNTSYYIVAP